MRHGKRALGGDESDVLDDEAIVHDLGSGAVPIWRVKNVSSFLARLIREGTSFFFGAFRWSGTSGAGREGEGDCGGEPEKPERRQLLHTDELLSKNSLEDLAVRCALSQTDSGDPPA
jgi:hypothetical protein